MKRSAWRDDPSQLSAVLLDLDRTHSRALAMDRAQIRYYYARPTLDYRDASNSSAALRAYDDYRTLSENLTEEVVDAACAQVIEDLRANVEPRAAGAALELQCRHMSLAIEGIFDQVEFDSLAEQAVLDGAICRVGVLWWYVDNSAEIRCERVDPLSYRWHPDEGRDPVHGYLSIAMSRDVAIARWPRSKAAIEKATTWHEPSTLGLDSYSTEDTIRVDVGYRRRIGNEVGCYAITCGVGKVLEHGKWDHSVLPFATFSWKSDHTGAGGVSLARSVIPAHVRVADMDRIARASLRGAVPRLVVHEDDVTESMSDLPYELIKWRGNRMPQLDVPNPVSPQVWEEIDRKKKGVYEQTGVNQAAAAGMRPAGLNSAPSQREWIDIAASRLKRQKSEFRRLYTRSARIALALGATAYADRDQVVRAPGTRILSAVNWATLDLREDQYQIRFSESSGLSKTFAARREEITELQSLGGMSQGAALRAIATRIPDVTSAANRASAAEDLANHIVDQALAHGVFSMPPSLDMTCIDAVVTIGTQEWERATLGGQSPPENIEILRRVIKAAQAKKKPPAPPTAPVPIPGEQPPPPPEPEPLPPEQEPIQ